jgi:hypothetical protein
MTAFNAFELYFVKNTIVASSNWRVIYKIINRYYKVYPYNLHEIKHRNKAEMIRNTNYYF